MPLKMIQNGRPQKQAGWYDELKLYYDNICNTDWVVTVGMMIYELKRLDPLLVDADSYNPTCITNVIIVQFQLIIPASLLSWPSILNHF